MLKKHTAIIINATESSNILISNSLQENFGMSARTYKELKHGLDFLMEHDAQLVVIDIDSIPKDSFERIEKLVSYKQVPTIILSKNPAADEIFGIQKDHPYIEILNTNTIKKQLVTSSTSLFARTGSTIKLLKRIENVSVSKKPKMFYLLATLLICEPLLKILYMKFSTGFDFEIVMRTVFSMQGFSSNFEFWCMFPIAGIALISEKSWSFLIFMAVQAYCLFAHFYYVEFTWPYVADSPHISSSFIMFINSAIILYFLVPEYRRPFWNKSQKLWRDTSRYATKLPIFFSTGKENLPTEITNISSTGAYFTSSENISIGEKTQLQFIIGGKVYEVSATVKRAHPTGQKNLFGYGVEFDDLAAPIKEVLSQYIESLETKLQ